MCAIDAAGSSGWNPGIYVAIRYVLPELSLCFVPRLSIKLDRDGIIRCGFFRRFEPESPFWKRLAGCRHDAPPLATAFTQTFHFMGTFSFYTLFRGPGMSLLRYNIIIIYLYRYVRIKIKSKLFKGRCMHEYKLMWKIRACVDCNVLSFTVYY